MAKMEDAALLSMLQAQEQESAQFTWGTLARERGDAAKEFYRQPYGNEEPGWSSIVTSEVQDTIEWILPDLIDMYLSSPDAVEFEPTQDADAEGAEQATDGCNYVFYKQNNGFLILYTAFKDALMFKNCATHWRKETRRSITKVPFDVSDRLELASIFQQGDKFSAAEEYSAPVLDPQTGQQVLGPLGRPMLQKKLRGTIARESERTVCKVEAFDPEMLGVQRDWTSPLLEDCPYVSRLMEVTLSQLHEMGFDDVTADDLASSPMPSTGNAMEQGTRRRGDGDELDGVGRMERMNAIDGEDESLTRGYLRIEWVLVDFDGDGIAERREVYRLADKILSNEECEEVPISTGSPILVQHRWDGMSIAEMMSDLQKLKTDLTRGVVNNAFATNNPRKMVLTDKNGAPYADVDDLLDNRPGGMLRMTQAGAVQLEATPFTGHQTFPLLEYVDTMGEKRTGVNKSQQGQDPNALRQDRTATEMQLLNNAAAKRIKLIARVLGETVVKPMFRGILRVLTSGDMAPLSFKLRGKFVQLNPNEWRDGYDMTLNVGLGTGDTEKQLAGLGAIFQTQMGLATSPLGPMFVTPQQLYNTQAKTFALRGFKNVSEFLLEPPEDAPLPTPPAPPPDPAIVTAQIRAASAEKLAAITAQLEEKKLTFEQAAKEREQNNTLTTQQTNDQRDAEREAAKDQLAAQLDGMKLAIERYKIDRDNATRIMVARISHPQQLPDGLEEDPLTGEVYETPDPMVPILEQLESLRSTLDTPKEIVRDESGRAVAVRQGDTVKTVIRDEQGRIAGAA